MPPSEPASDWSAPLGTTHAQKTWLPRPQPPATPQGTALGPRRGAPMDRARGAPGSAGLAADSPRRRHRPAAAPKSFLIRDILGDCSENTATEPADGLGSAGSRGGGASGDARETLSPSPSAAQASPTRDVPPDDAAGGGDLESAAGSAGRAVGMLSPPAGLCGVLRGDSAACPPESAPAAAGQTARCGGRPPAAAALEWLPGAEVPPVPLLPWPAPLLCAPRLYLERWQGLLQSRLRDCRPPAPTSRPGKRHAGALGTVCLTSRLLVVHDQCHKPLILIHCKHFSSTFFVLQNNDIVTLITCRQLPFTMIPSLVLNPRPEHATGCPEKKRILLFSAIIPKINI